MKWEKVIFGELFDSPSRNGIYIEQDKHGAGVKMVNMGEIFAYDFIGAQDMKRVELSLNEMSTLLLREDDLLFARRSLVESGAGKSSIVQGLKEPTTFESSIIRVRLKSSLCCPLFYLYWLRSLAGKEAIGALVTGTNVKGIRGSELKNIKVDYPPYAIQIRIANVLKEYDNLIENNQKQIKLLEEAAQRLYKEWFVDLRFPGHENTKITDGVPEGWSVQSINDIAEYINGYAFKPSDWGNLGKPIIKIKEMGSGIASDTPRNTGESIPERYNVTAGDILFSWSATLSAKIWDEEDGLLNQHLFKVIPHGGVSREFVLQSILKTLDEFSNLTTGSTMKHIQRGKLKEVHIIVPNEQMMHIYESISEPSREQILKLKKRIVILQEARDRLLPKLMSGEIEV